jgi:hypothetical protein
MIISGIATAAMVLPLAPPGSRWWRIEVISGSNSHWLRGYGDPPPKLVIAVGFLRTDLEKVFESCELAGHFTIP